ncbi:HlyD family secretion protein [Aliterella atlantica]|nr:HlyD family secretion protein [Aliterella atlantica]
MGTSLNGKQAVVEPEAIKELAAEVVVVKAPEIQIAPPEKQEEAAPPPEKPKAKRKPKGLILAVLGVGALASGVFGYRYWQYASSHQTTDNATVAGHIYQVSAKVPGTVDAVLVDDNQLVQKGQLLVKLDPQDYQNKVQQVQASIQAAKSQADAAQENINLAAQNSQAQNTQAQGSVNSAIAAIASAQAAVNEAQAGIPAAQAEVAQAQANLQKAQVDYNRYQSLFNQGAIARQQLDTAKAAYEVARAQTKAAQQGVAQAQAKLAQAREGVTTAQANLAESRGKLQQATATGVQTNVNRSQYQAAKAAIAQSEASLKDAQLQLSYIKITAPSSGRIGRKSVEVGQRVQSGTPLMAVVGNEYWVVANFKETQLENMQPNEEAEVKLDAFPHHTFTGRVESISPASGAQFALLPPDNATGNFTKIVQRVPVKIVLDAQSIKGYESRITPGMSAEVEVTIK